MRASDADRHQVAEVLRDAAGDGRLTLDELQERLDGVYSARTYAELERFTRDLPASRQRADAGDRPRVPPASAHRRHRPAFVLGRHHVRRDASRCVGRPA